MNNKTLNNLFIHFFAHCIIATKTCAHFFHKQVSCAQKGDACPRIVCVSFRLSWYAEKTENTSVKFMEVAGFAIESKFGVTPEDGNEVLGATNVFRTICMKILDRGKHRSKLICSPNINE